MGRRYIGLEALRCGYQHQREFDLGGDVSGFVFFLSLEENTMTNQTIDGLRTESRLLGSFIRQLQRVIIVVGLKSSVYKPSHRVE